MRHSSGRSTFAAVLALVIAALLAAPVSADDSDAQPWPELSTRDLAIVDCMSTGDAECAGRTQHKTDPELWPTEQGQVWLPDPKLYSLPALSGPSAAEVLRYHATQGSPGTISQRAGATSP